MHAMEDRDRLGRLKAAFEATGMSQADLARVTKQSTANITRWLNGDNRVAARKLPGLAAALGVSVEFLLTGEEGGEAKAYAAAARAEKERKEWQAEALRLRGELERLRDQLGLILPGRSASAVAKPRPGSRRGPTKQ